MLFLSLCIVLGGLFTAELLLFSLHLDYLAPFVGAVICGALMLAFFCVKTEMHHRWEHVSLFASLVLLLVQPVTAWQNTHTRFVLFNHTPLAGSTAHLLNDLLDIDGDATASAWLGGTDCAGFDAERSPVLRERPLDGIDQDCSGKDSEGMTPEYRIRPLLSECRNIPKQPSILLITIEAFRFDALGPGTTPRLWHFGRQAIQFSRAYTASPYTNYSTLALFTGRPMTALTNRNPLNNNRYCASPSVTEVLRSAGYDTAFFCHVDVPKALWRGFDHKNHYRTPLDHLGNKLFSRHGALMSATTTNAAIDHLRHRPKRPAFLWLHYIDTHAPYRGPPSRGLPETMASPYLKTLAYVDYHIGRLLDYLQKQKEARSTVVIITGDHGEDLGQRGREGHGPYLFESSIHVPLLVWIPGCPSGTVHEPVGLTQLASTVAEAAGVSFPGVPLLTKSVPSLPVISEALVRSHFGFTRLQRALVTKRYKLLVDEKLGGRMLFDLARDPREADNIYYKQPHLAKQLEARYQNWLDRADVFWEKGCTPGWDFDGGVPMVFGAITSPASNSGASALQD